MRSGEYGSCIDYLHDHWATPERFIIDTFNHRDVVLLAEDHAIRHNLLLVQRLIPLLHEAGVYHLGMEFGASEDQPVLDALTTAEVYDEDLARRLMFNYNTGWSYQEYMDVYRAAWAFNRTRSAGARPFRVLNLSYRYDWSDALPLRTPEITKQIFPKGGTEQYRAGLVSREILERHEKILILTGTIHALTRCPMPEFDYNAEGFVRYEDRDLGHLLHRLAPRKVFTILLHQPFDSKLAGPLQRVRPAGGAIDRIMELFEDKRVGFGLVTSQGLTPPGNLPDDSFYASGRHGFCLGDLADGYIYEKPFIDYEGCTVDTAFMTEANWLEAQHNFPDPAWHRRPENPEAYWDHVFRYVNIEEKYADVR